MKKINKNITDAKDKFENINIPPEINITIENAIIRAKNHKKLQHLKYAKLFSSLAAVFIAAILCFSSSDFNLKKVSKKASVSEIKSNNKSLLSSELPSVGSLENFKKLMNDYLLNNKANSYESQSKLSENDTAKLSSDASIAKDTSNSVSNSVTNVQVQGIDEADIVKNDNKYIYKLSGNKINIINAYPANEMKTISTIEIKDYMTRGLMLYKNTLIVISQQNCYISKYNSSLENSAQIQKGDCIHGNLINAKTKVSVYNIKDKKNPKNIRDIELDGNYISARLINNTLYTVTEKDLSRLLNDSSNSEDLKPGYTDSKNKGLRSTIDFKDIRYMKEALAPSYIILSSLNLNNETFKLTSVLGSASNLYCSENNLYAAGVKYSGDIQTDNIYSPTVNFETHIYKFNLNNGTVSFCAEGMVYGTILNQYSMDEYNGFFRIAVTQRNSKTYENSNSIYIFDKDMKQTGSLENLEKGERIYSVRFMEDRGYVVTYRNTDPFLCIDLSDPYNIKLSGELKLPGFSSYLHPYDRNTIIGIGMNSDEKTGRNLNMKISVFNVSDIKNPVEISSLNLKDISYSNLLYDSKALLFDKNKGILAFPAYECKNDEALIFNIDSSCNIKLKQKLVFKKCQRIIYIGNTLYTISDNSISAFDINSLLKQNEINF